MDDTDQGTDGLDTRAVIAWVLLLAGDDPEVITLTEAGRAALAAAEDQIFACEDAEFDAVIEQRNFHDIGGSDA